MAKAKANETATAAKSETTLVLSDSLPKQWRKGKSATTPSTKKTGTNISGRPAIIVVWANQAEAAMYKSFSRPLALLSFKKATMLKKPQEAVAGSE